MDDLNLTGGLGSIPDNIVGKTSLYLKIDEKDADEGLSLGLSEMFASRRESNIHLLPNDERLAGIYDTGLEVQREKRLSDAVKIAKLQATNGKNAMELIQYLKKDLTDDDIRSLPGIRDILNAPFIWAFFIDDPSAFDSCDQARSSLRSLESKRKSLAVLAGPKCSGCLNNENGLCRKFGKNLVNSINFTPEMFRKISEFLRMQGVIKTDQSLIPLMRLKPRYPLKKIIPFGFIMPRKKKWFLQFPGMMP